MDKRQYKQLMEQIQMSDACEQRILNAVHQTKIPQLKKHITWRKRAGIALAAAACVAVVSVFSVAAAQNTSLLEKLFPWAESVDVPETAVFTNGQIESFTVDGMDGLDITPVGVVNDAKNVYLMMRIVPSDPDFNPAKRAIVDYNSGSGIVYPMINGENKLDDAEKDDPYYLGKYEFFERTDIPEEDGSYTAFYQLQFTNGITFDHLNFTIGLTDITDLIEKQNGFVKSEQTELLGTIDVTVSLDTSVQEVTLNYTEPIAIPNKNGTGYLKHLEIQALSMQLSGTGDMLLGQHVYVEPDFGQTQMKEGIWIDESYVVKDGDDAYVWTLNKKDKLEKTKVELGDYDENLMMYEIKSGLSKDDYIVWASDDLYEGEPAQTWEEYIENGGGEDTVYDNMGTEALDDQMLEGTEGGPVDDGTMDEGAADATGSGDAEVQ